MSELATAVAVWALTWFAVAPRRAPWKVLQRFDTTERAPGLPSRSTSHSAERRRATPLLAGRRHTGATARSHTETDVPVVADLLAVAVGAGSAPGQAFADVAAVQRVAAADSPVVAAAERLERGEDITTVLDDLARAGSGWHGLATLLSLSVDSGASPVVALRGLASQERMRIRRERERSARRLPVLLLLPLTLLVLPAFLLVTVVPFVVAGGSAIELPQSNPNTRGSND